MNFVSLTVHFVEQNIIPIGSLYWVRCSEDAFKAQRAETSDIQHIILWIFYIGRYIICYIVSFIYNCYIFILKIYRHLFIYSCIQKWIPCGLLFDPPLSYNNNIIYIGCIRISNFLSMRCITYNTADADIYHCVGELCLLAHNPLIVHSCEQLKTLFVG